MSSHSAGRGTRGGGQHIEAAADPLGAIRPQWEAAVAEAVKPWKAPPKQHHPLPGPTRIITKEEVSARTSYSAHHLMRLAKQGLFPRPIKFGDSKAARVGWIEDEVESFLRSKAEARATAPAPA
jgi:predicted DNA-binding transcriptional regulator AlpA